ASSSHGGHLPAAPPEERPAGAGLFDLRGTLRLGRGAGARRPRVESRPRAVPAFSARSSPAGRRATGRPTRLTGPVLACGALGHDAPPRVADPRQAPKFPLTWLPVRLIRSHASG